MTKRRKVIDMGAEKQTTRPMTAAEVSFHERNKNGLSPEMQIYEGVCAERMAWEKSNPGKRLPKSLADKDKAAHEAIYEP